MLVDKIIRKKNKLYEESIETNNTIQSVGKAFLSGCIEGVVDGVFVTGAIWTIVGLGIILLNKPNEQNGPDIQD